MNPLQSLIVIFVVATTLIAAAAMPAAAQVPPRFYWKTLVGTNAVPVIGMAGVYSARDALEFIIAGASAVAVGTANFTDPTITTQVIAGIEAFLIKNKISSVSDLVGSVKI